MQRKIDELGRIVLPGDYRKALELQVNDEIEVMLRENEIIIRKSNIQCCFCGSAANLIRIGDKAACRSCVDGLHAAKDGDALYLEQKNK